MPAAQLSPAQRAQRARSSRVADSGPPFRLVRHFSVASLLGILAVLAVLVMFYRQTAFDSIREHQSRSNVELARVFANTLWPAHAAFISTAGQLPRSELAQHAGLAALRVDVLQQIRGLNVVKVKVYDLAGITIFSTDPKQIGEDKRSNAGFRAARAGGAASEITFRDRFDAFEGVINDRNLVSSYIPVRKRDGAAVEAVMEVYSDVTEFVNDLERTQWLIAAAVMGSLALLYLFLLAIARRADGILRTQREEARMAHRAVLHHQASHDALTELPNRASFADRVDQMLKAARRNTTKVAVLCMDVHGLREVNASFGLATGDRLLKEVARRLGGVLREADVTARRGGVEFAAAVYGIRGVEHAANIAEKVLRALTQVTYPVDGQTLAITLNLGIGIFPDDARAPAELIASAEAAMHHARHRQRNSYQFHTADMNARARAMLLTEQDLRRALERSEFLLHYQPQVDVATNAIIGAEALIRWNHPGRGLVSPGEFIPIAEERDLIVPIGRWVLREACRQSRAWQDAGLPPLPIAVNLSALQFQQQDLAREIGEVLQECRLDAQLLELELTESAVLRDVSRSVAAMHAMKEVGVRLSLDDFGTGYSSLGRLKSLPLDKLKIDQSFVRDLPGDRYDLAISSAIVGMGKALDLTVIAEGVETREQLQTLRSIGCNGIQGYLLSKPLPVDDYVRFARERLSPRPRQHPAPTH